MAEKIKKFFAKKKADAKFKLAGPGRKLTDSSGSFVGPSKQNSGYKPPENKGPTDATKQAAEAALARFNSRPQGNKNAFTSLSAVQAQVRRELEAERRNQEGAKNVPPPSHKVIETELEASPLLAVKGVYFRCPMISEEVLSREEWRVKIKQFLYEQLEEETGLTACLMIHSCNYNKTKVTDCVDILCKYLDNIISNPGEPKFQKIRCSNPTFSEKVLSICGTPELLCGAGFTIQFLEHNGNKEDFYVWDEKNVDGIQTLEFLRDSLKSEDRIELELDRNLQVLSPAQAAKQVELPREFYAISPAELKKEQQSRSEATEKLTQLRTKAMREKDELRELRKYKFALIRVRFPDGLFLQGTFSVYEKFAEVVDYVHENLANPQTDYVLCGPTGHKFDDADKESSLVDLRLVPATILTFEWMSEEATATPRHSYLKDEVMMLVQSI